MIQIVLQDFFLFLDTKKMLVVLLSLSQAGSQAGRLVRCQGLLSIQGQYRIGFFFLCLLAVAHDIFYGLLEILWLWSCVDHQ